MSEKSILKAVENLKSGGFIIVTDDQDRENEGDLVIAAEKITPEAMTFLINHTSGIVCVAMTGKRLDHLKIPQMVAENTEAHKTAFTVSVDYLPETTTGVSAKDRYETIKALIHPDTTPEDLSRPGHIFPLRYREGGVLKRAGHTEAAVDLTKMANMLPAGVICELVNLDGTMARTPDIKAFSLKYGIPIVSVSEIVRYRRSREKIVTRISDANIPTRYGDFKAYVFKSKLDDIEHLALVKGDVEKETETLVRVHSECLTGDVFGSRRCDCGAQLDLALEKISHEGSGVVVYLRGHEGRGIGLGHKLRAYHLQEQGKDTVEANEELGFPPDNREYGIGAQILADLGLTKIKLMTNNPAKYGGLNGFDIEIVERVPLSSKSTVENRAYLQTKKEKLGHLLEI